MAFGVPVPDYDVRYPDSASRNDQCFQEPIVAGIPHKEAIVSTSTTKTVKTERKKRNKAKRSVKKETVKIMLHE